MERAENEVHGALQDVAAFGGLELLEKDGENLDYETVATTQRFQQQQQQHQQQIHTLRRLLRRLDRSLLRLEDEVVLKNNNAVLLSNEVCTDLLTLLTRLRMPLDDSNALDIALSVNTTVSRLWTGLACSVQDPNDMRMLLRRIVQHATTGHRHSTRTTSLFSLCAPWLKVVNYQWTNQRVLVHDNPDGALPGGQHSVTTTDPAIAVLQSKQILQGALDSFQVAKHWDVNHVQDELSDAILQWRNLTGFLIEHIVQLYLQQQQQQQQIDTEQRQSMQSVSEWLEQCFAAINPQYQQDQHASHLADQLVENLQLYVTDLVDFALDSLDGAGAVVADRTSIPSSSHKGDEEPSASNNNNNNETVVLAVRDSLRHVWLATHALQALNALALVHSDWPLKLWKTLATSFVHEPGTTSHELIPRELGAGICHYTLTVAELALEVGNDPPKTTLAMTFLRGLPYPDRLMVADQFWKALQSQLLSRDDGLDLKHVLQASVLTLQQSATAKSSSQCTDSEESGGQLETLIQRILQVLRVLVDEKSASSVAPDNQDSIRGRDPWDELFSRRLQGSNVSS